MKEKLEIFSFGGLKILHNDTPVTGLASRKAHALLVYLAVSGSPQTRDHLADLFWEERTQSQARANLRVLIWSLNKRLEPFFQIEQESVALINDGRIYLDVAAFQQFIEERDLDRAIELYKGGFLQGFNIRGASEFDHWIISQNELYHQHALEALQALVDRSLRFRDYQEGIRYARKLLTLNPLVESGHRNLMRMLALTGHRDQALEQYRHCSEVLANELAVRPSSETETLHQQIVAGVFSLEYPGFESGIDLPAKLTPFVGRSEDLEELERLLSDEPCRMLTIAGPGGIGKSRLAIEVTKRILDLFPDGVFYLSLVGLDSVQSLYPTIADALKLKLGEAADTAFWIKNYLREKRCLLLFDNFEHLLAGKQVVADILAAAPLVKALITSRQKLRLEGEIVYWLDGLCLPPIDTDQFLSRFDASNLFMKRAYGGNAPAGDARSDASHITRICHLVEGLPLGIELAAAWVDVLRPEAIARQLESGLGLLQTDVDTLPDRHKSFKVVFEHSWELLSSDEQAVAMALSVFRGGFDLRAAEQVASADIHDLRALVNKSLVHAIRGGRYQVHELLRQSAATKSEAFPKELERVQAQHCDYYLGLLNRWDEDLKSARQPEAMALIEIDLGNIQKAWGQAVDTEAVASLRLGLDGLCRYYCWRRRYDEALAACQLTVKMLLRKIEAGSTDSSVEICVPLLIRTLSWQSRFTRQEAGDVLLTRAQTYIYQYFIDSPETLAFFYHQQADRIADTRPQQAVDLYKKSLALCEELGLKWETGDVCTALGWAYTHLGRYEEAKRISQKSLLLNHSLGEPRGLADALWLEGSLAILDDDSVKADALISESLDIRSQLGERITDIASKKQDIGMTLTWLGKLEEACAVREETLKIYQERGLAKFIPNAYSRLAFSQAHLGDTISARESAENALKLAMEIEDYRIIGLGHFLIGGCELLEGHLEGARQHLQASIDAFSGLNAAGELGWGYAILADAELKLHNMHGFFEALLSALEVQEGFLSTPTAWIVGCSFVDYLIEIGEYEYMAELYIFFCQYPLMRESEVFLRISGRRAREIMQTLSPEIINQARERGLKRELLATLEEIKTRLTHDSQELAVRENA